MPRHNIARVLLNLGRRLGYLERWATGGVPVTAADVKLLLGEANLAFNPDFGLRHRLHTNQPLGWISKGQTQTVGEMGDE